MAAGTWGWDASDLSGTASKEAGLFCKPQMSPSPSNPFLLARLHFPKQVQPPKTYHRSPGIQTHEPVLDI